MDRLQAVQHRSTKKHREVKKMHTRMKKKKRDLDLFTVEKRKLRGDLNVLND